METIEENKVGQGDNTSADVIANENASAQEPQRDFVIGPHELFVMSVCDAIPELRKKDIKERMSDIDVGIAWELFVSRMEHSNFVAPSRHHDEPASEPAVEPEVVDPKEA